MWVEHEEASTMVRDDFERFRRSERTRRDTERKRKDMAVKKFIVVRAGLAAIAVTALAACGSGSSDSPASSAASGASSVASSAAPSTSASTSTTGSTTASATQTQSTAASAQGSTSTTAGAAAPSASASRSGMTSAPSTARSSASPSTNAAAAHDAPRRYTAAVWGLFTTPSGTQHCQVSADSASCYLSSAAMAKHQGSNVVLLAKDGWLFNTSNLGSNEGGSGSAWAKSGGASPKVLNGMPVLSYGSSLSAGSNTCKSSPAGVTCSNGVASFTLNSRGVTTTGAKASR